MNSQLAGGDMDGDMNMVSFDEKRVDFVDGTQAALDRLEIRKVMDQLDRELPKRTVPWEPGHGERAVELRRHACAMPTPSLRGRVCAMAERAARVALQAGDPVADGSWGIAMELAIAAHRAMDVPKHYDADAVSSLASSIRRRGAVAGNGTRSTADMADALRPALPCVSSGRAFTPFLPLLAEALHGVALGQVLFPPRISASPWGSSWARPGVCSAPTEWNTPTSGNI